MGERCTIGVEGGSWLRERVDQPLISTGSPAARDLQARHFSEVRLTPIECSGRCHSAAQHVVDLARRSDLNRVCAMP